MSSLSFPDVNVWLALAAPEHVHSAAALVGRGNRPPFPG